MTTLSVLHDLVLLTVLVCPVDQGGHFSIEALKAVLEVAGFVQSHGVDIGLHTTHESCGTPGTVSDLGVGGVGLWEMEEWVRVVVEWGGGGVGLWEKEEWVRVVVEWGGGGVGLWEMEE